MQIDGRQVSGPNRAGTLRQFNTHSPTAGNNNPEWGEGRRGGEGSDVFLSRIFHGEHRLPLKITLTLRNLFKQLNINMHAWSGRITEAGSSCLVRQRSGSSWHWLHRHPQKALVHVYLSTWCQYLTQPVKKEHPRPLSPRKEKSNLCFFSGPSLL